MKKPTIKICHIIHTLHIGGAELLLLKICRELLARHPDVYDFTVIASYEAGPLEEEFEKNGIRVVSLNLAGKRLITCVWRIYLALKQIKPHIVHTHLFPPDRYGQIAAFLARIKYRISTIHSMEPRLSMFEYITIVLLRILASEMVSVSVSAKRHYTEKYGFADTKIHVIHSAPVHALPEKNGSRPSRLSDGPIRLVNLDNCKQAKGQIFLVPAIRELVKIRPAVRLDIIGDHTTEYAERVMAEVSNQKVEPFVAFLGRIANPIPALSSYHLMISLSLWEGFHLSLVEGMALGLPIVTTPIPMHKELFDGIENFPFVNHDEPGMIADAICRIVSDEDYYDYLSRQNSIRARTFSSDTMVDKYNALYSSLVA